MGIVACGNWALTEKECLSPVVKHGEAYSPNKTFEYESEAHFFCNEGVLAHFLYHSGYPDPIEFLTIEDVLELACPPPPKICNGHLIRGHAAPCVPGMTVTYTCDPGYLLVGKAFIFCTHQGTWSQFDQDCKGPYDALVVVKFHEGNDTDEKSKEGIIHLHPQESNHLHPQTLQTNQENSSVFLDKVL
ncbi:Complement Receptor Type 1 [Manis pentadactyla]|nr:Complement Receptor Type 1 [Manis pentadactyla]